jgi:hypothetical protein
MDIDRTWLLAQQNASVPSEIDLGTLYPAPMVRSRSKAYSFTADVFRPYVDLFFEHMFVIMPVLDRARLFNPWSESTERLDTASYCLLCALSAATIVQLDDSIVHLPATHPETCSDASFVEECLRIRSTLDFIEDTTTTGVLTSFFLFSYYGNIERHTKAWHYLQESITMAENLNMDDERSYEQLDPAEAQWRRRLYWLLFITERAYAVQRRKHARLHTSIGMPAVFESDNPKLLHGLVKLADLFSAVDEAFVQAWRGSRRTSLCNENWLARTQKRLDATTTDVIPIGLTETQHLDIAITREWLHVLAWQMGVSNGLIWTEGEGSMRLDYPVELAKNVVEITSGATPLAIDSHGIGMVSFSEHVDTSGLMMLAGTKDLRYCGLPRRCATMHGRYVLIVLQWQKVSYDIARAIVQHTRERVSIFEAFAVEDGPCAGQ